MTRDGEGDDKSGAVCFRPNACCLGVESNFDGSTCEPTCPGG